jgi:hypothetical protein
MYIYIYKTHDNIQENISIYSSDLLTHYDIIQTKYITNYDINER